MICVPLTNPCIFEPPISSPDKEEEEGEGGNGDKIRVHAFTEVVRILRKQSSDKNTDEGPPDITVQIPSRRSLLALQLGVWTALQRLVPMVSGRGDSIQSSDQRNYIELINTLISSSKSTSLLSRRPSSCETHFLDWSYSRADVMIHSLLLLRTKMAVAGLFTDIISSSDGSKGTVSVGLIHGMNGLAMGPSINLALMAVETAKHHLLWDRNDSEDSHSETDGIPSQFSRELEHSMGSMSSWAVSNFMALAVLFPDIEDKSNVWSNSFPHLMECIPIIADSSNGSLRKVMVRIIHAMLANSERLSSNHLAESLSIDDSFNTISFIDQFKNQCLARGYFSHLFGLVKDSSESVSSTAVSIVVLLLESFSDSISEALLETACSDAIGSLEDREPADLDPSKDSPLVRLGSKRRKLVLGKADKGPISYGASIQSAFTHAASDRRFR